MRKAARVIETSPEPLPGEVSIAPPSRTHRGGARNSASRESHSLNSGQVGNLIAAAEHAAAIGLPLNRFVSIHWQHAGVPLGEMAKATGKFTGLLAKALVRHGSAAAWLWVHENGHRKGGHCHLLAHVPADLVAMVNGKQRRWLKAITGKTYVKNTIRSIPVGGRLGLEQYNPWLHHENLEEALGYVLKGASPEAAAHHGLVRLEPGGYIIGKRCGTSQSIGVKARSGKQELQTGSKRSKAMPKAKSGQQALLCYQLLG